MPNGDRIDQEQKSWSGAQQAPRRHFDQTYNTNAAQVFVLPPCGFQDFFKFFGCNLRSIKTLQLHDLGAVLEQYHLGAHLNKIRLKKHQNDSKTAREDAKTLCFRQQANHQAEGCEPILPKLRWPPLQNTLFPTLLQQPLPGTSLTACLIVSKLEYVCTSGRANVVA